MGSFLSDHLLFLREFRRSFRSTGAIAPSGRRLSRALARFAEETNGTGRPRRILEVGPGTGAVTRQIVPLLRKDEHLDLVELNESFVQHLKARVQDDPLFGDSPGRVEVLHADVTHLPRQADYDLIISGLPLNNFAAADVEAIFEAFSGLLRPGGTLSFFEYVAVRPLRAVVSSRTERQRLRDVGKLITHMLMQEIRRELVVANTPPAWVHHVRLSSSSPSGRG